MILNPPKSSINLKDNLPNNIRPNNKKSKLVPFNIKMNLVSYNKKTEYPVKQSNSRNFICNIHTFFSESFEL